MAQPSGRGGKQGANLGFRSWFLILQNVIGAVLSVPVLVTGILIARGNQGDCATFMNKPIIAIGALLLFVSLAGLLAAISDKVSRHPILAWFHLLLMFLLVILLFCFAIFCLEITNKGLAHTVTGYGQKYKEYRLDLYPKWMRHRVNDPNYWSKVKSCLQKSSNCEGDVLPNAYSNITHVTLANLPPIKGGCCIPPSACKITYLGVPNAKKANDEGIHFANQHDVETKATKGNKIEISTTMTSSSTINTTSQENNHNTTKLLKTTLEHTINSTTKQLKTTLEHTINSTKKSTSHNAMDITLHAYTRDCKYWSALPDQLCYDCDTCRAAILQDSMNRWKHAAILYVVLVMVMILLCALFTCYGFKEHPHRKNNTNIQVSP